MRRERHASDRWIPRPSARDVVPPLLVWAVVLAVAIASGLQADRSGRRALAERFDDRAAMARRHLFERFFRSSTAVGAAIPGTGLGLAVSKAIVDAHDGTIAATPGDRGGTVFAVELPATADVVTVP